MRFVTLELGILLRAARRIALDEGVNREAAEGESEGAERSHDEAPLESPPALVAADERV